MVDEAAIASRPRHLGAPETTDDRYRPLHPEIFRYDPAFLDPVLLRGDPAEVLREEAEQIYHLQLFTEEYCRLLVEEAEHCGQWRTKVDVDVHPRTRNLVDVSEPDTTHHLHPMHGLEEVYQEVVERHLRPLMERTWRSFRMQRSAPGYILKYSADGIRSMALHHGIETVALLVYLNTDFDGGGTYFPKWNYLTSARRAGAAVLFPGGLAHEHAGLPIHSGRRYLFCGSFY